MTMKSVTGQIKRAAALAAFLAVVGTIAIGRALHVLGLRHHGGHVATELAALWALAFVGILAASAGAKAAQAGR